MRGGRTTEQRNALGHGHPHPHAWMEQISLRAPESADLIGHLQEVEDVHFGWRVISTSQQGMEVWDRRRNTLLVDHII